MKPIDVTEDNDWQEFYTLYGPVLAATGVTPELEFKPGKQVRITKYKTTVRKGYLPNRTDEVFIVSKVVYAAGLGTPHVYNIKDLNGEEILGNFYTDELQGVTGGAGADKLYRVERILKTKTVRGKKYYLIKWKGYPESFYSWEPEENVIRTM
ncbi:uncharacterized protein [Ptychodera flava]|uniref:uncharacterized protein n=1 Tax=Ptychodera flava TaxID=63121 RepID=UPI00396AA0C8